MRGFWRRFRGVGQPLPANLSLDGNLDLGSIEAFPPNDLEAFAGLLEARNAEQKHVSAA